MICTSCSLIRTRWDIGVAENKENKEWRDAPGLVAVEETREEEEDAKGNGAAFVRDVVPPTALNCRGNCQ